MTATLRPGDRIGRYLVETELGEGGMGRVYRAYDEVLRRRVAIKVLHASNVASGSGASAPTVARILREARMAAALEHPNVVAVYDFGEENGAPYIVMEHLTGRSLRELEERDDVPMSERVRWLVDVARALSAAHRAGLVHRDVKPENVIVRDDGVVKVLDFGIAKRESTGRGDERAAIDPARATTQGGTLEDGTIAGTPAYMAPEQIRGEPVDARTDQFAWAVLAYELLSRRSPWNEASVLTSILADEPAPLDAASLRAPPKLVDAVHRALGKSPADRFASMDALLSAIGASATPSIVPPPSSARRQQIAVAETVPAVESGASRSASGVRSGAGLGARWIARPSLVVAAFGVVAVVAFSLVAWRRARVVASSRVSPSASSAPSSSASSARPSFVMRDAKRITFAYACEEFPSFTADGATIVFDGLGGTSDYHVFALDLATGAQRALTDEKGWQYAAQISPDGKSIVYVQQSERDLGTWLAPIDRSSPPKLLARGNVRPTWTADGAVWCGAEDRPLRVDAKTGAVQRALTAPKDAVVVMARELADGRIVALVGPSNFEPANGLVIYPRWDAPPRWLMKHAADEVLVVLPGDAHVLVARIEHENETRVWIVPLDGSPPWPAEASTFSPTKGIALSPTADRAVWSTCNSRPELAVVHFAPNGEAQPRTLFPATTWSDTDPADVPGTSRVIVASDRSGPKRLWMLDTVGTDAHMIDTGELAAERPAVSPDGRWIAFTSPGLGIHLAPIEGKSVRRLTFGETDTSPSFSADGGSLYFETAGSDGRRVDVVDLASGKTQNLIAGGARRPTASPKEPLLVYLAVHGTSDEGIPMLLDRRTGGMRPLSSALREGNHDTMHFSPDGRRIAVAVGDAMVVQIDVATGNIASQYDAGSESLFGFTFLGDDLLVARGMWSGDLWMGVDPLGAN